MDNRIGKPMVAHASERMNRRAFIATATGILAAPLAAEAQTATVPRIGVLLTVNPERPQAWFREALRDQGYVEGQNVLGDYRSAAGQTGRLAELAADLVRLKADIIVAQSTPSVQAAMRATATIPIIMAPAGDPVGSGLVASLARPGAPRCTSGGF